MATIINIRRDVRDGFYRYKMPKLISKIEGKGNGIKTVIPNMSDVARSLSRPASYPTKYFGCELGAQVKCDEKTDRYIVNGAHDAEKLQSLLDGFISKFVLCASCLNPETNLIVTKDGRILRDCQACGKQSEVDPRHRLSTFIVKNPPDTVQTTGKKDKHAKKIAAAADGQALSAAAGGGASDTDANGGNSPSAASEKERKSKRKHARKGDGDVADQVDALQLHDDDEEETEGMPEYVDFVTQNADAAPQALYEKAQELWLKDDRAVAALVQLLFTEDVLGQIAERTPTIRVFLDAAGSEKAERRIQKGVLAGLEKLVGLRFPDALMAKFPIILKAFYDADLLDEEVILEWSKKVSRRNVDKKTAKELHARAEPLVRWLEEADEVSSSVTSDSGESA